VVDSIADFLVSRDYNGDGRPDPAVWRPWGGVWLIDNPPDGVRIERLGQPGDLPAPADYDDDGRAEPAVWRPDTATLAIAAAAGQPATELSPASLQRLGGSLYLLAQDLMGQHRSVDAFLAAQQRVVVAERLAELDPAQRLLLVEALVHVCAWRAADAEAALVAGRRAVGIAEHEAGLRDDDGWEPPTDYTQVATAEPNTAWDSQYLPNALFTLGHVYWEAGDHALAFTAMTHRAQIWQRLAELDPALQPRAAAALLDAAAWGTRAFAERALALFRVRRHADAHDATLAGIAHFAAAVETSPGLSDDPLRRAAETWASLARAAHPNDIPGQLAAARNGWEILRFVAGRPGDRLAVARQLHTVSRFLAFGSPSMVVAVEAATLSRRVFASFGGDHRLDIAGSWATQAVSHHEAAQSDPAQYAAQYEAASQAWEIYRTVADELPAGDVRLADIAYQLNTGGNLIGLLPVDLAVAAATTAREIYTRLTAHNPAADHRMDSAGAWHRQAATLHPAQPAAQEEAARRAWEIYKALADELLATAEAAADARLADIAYQLNTGGNLIGLLPVDLAVAAATTAREIYTRLTAHDPTIDRRMHVAGSWGRQAVMLHPAQPEAQEEAASQAWDIYKTLADGLLAAATESSRTQLTSIAEQLDHLAGYLPPNLVLPAAETSQRIRSFLNR
jgi:hypothetical protein